MAVERRGFSSAIWNTSYNQFFGPPGDSYRFIDPFTHIIIDNTDYAPPGNKSIEESYVRFKDGTSSKRELPLVGFAVSHASRCVLATANAINLDSDFITKFITVEPMYVLEDGRSFDPFWTQMYKYENGFEEKVKETHAMMKYICTKFVGPSCYLYPMQDSERTYRIDLRLNFDLCKLEPAVQDHISSVIKERRMLPLKDEIRTLLRELEEMLTRSKFLVDQSISLADIAVVTTVTMLELVKFDFSPYPAICDWLQRVKILPFYRLTNAAYEEYKLEAWEHLK